MEIHNLATFTRVDGTIGSVADVSFHFKDDKQNDEEAAGIVPIDREQRQLDNLLQAMNSFDVNSGSDMQFANNQGQSSDSSVLAVDFS